MFFKFVFVAVVVGVATGFPRARPDSPPVYNGEHLPPPPPPYHPPAPTYEEEPKKPFAFDYGVRDDYSGNNYQHAANSDGDAVQGSYTVVLPDGRIQTVSYVADHYNGYQAQVEYQGEAQYPETKPYQPAPYGPPPSYPVAQPPQYPVEPPPQYPVQPQPQYSEHLPPPPTYEEEPLPPVYLN